MSKKFFRPPANFMDSDSDSDDDDDNLSDEEEEPRGRSAAKPPTNATTANLSSSDDDDDDDDEDPPDKSNNKRKASGAGESRNKRPKASAFFDMEAEASDEEDDDEDDGGRKRPTDADGEQMDREALEMMKLQDRRRAQAGGAFMERTAAEMARDIEERHRMQRRPVNQARIRQEMPSKGRGSGASPAAPSAPAPRVHHMAEAEDDGYAADAAVAQQSLVPSVSDPSFWMISCATGKEQDMVMQIMNKAVAMARQGKPLGITGAIAAQSKGRIYVEGFSEPQVMEAIQNIRGLLQYTMRLVPIGDMTTVMTVTPKKKPVQKNEWVRMTRGHYKGDLALVIDVKDSGLKCIVQCVPRLDLTLGDLTPEEARVRRRTIKPPQKFFSPQELKAMGKHNILRQLYPGTNMYCYAFEGNFFKDGYLIKEMTVGSMVKPCTEEDPPNLEELQRFQRRKGAGREDDDDEDEGGEENAGSKLAGSLLDELMELQEKTGFDKQTSKPGSGLLIGDTVEVVEGDLVGVRGKVISLDGSTVKIKPLDAEITDEIEFLANQVRKYIEVGAHVKVMDGRYANETGTVVATEKSGDGQDFTAIVLTDVTNNEITVRISQLRESAEMATTMDVLHGYRLYDLVVLSGGGSANEVGVIVRVGREDFTVINNHGIDREVRPEELRGKKNGMSDRAVALDVQGNQLRSGDTVNVVDGRHKGKSATIKRMNRSQLFLHSQTKSDHAGIFVVKSRSCVLAGSRTQNRSGAGDGGATPWTPQSTQSSRGPGAGRKRDDGLIGKTVRIQAGNWKGFIGTVSDTTGTHVQVELHARLKKVMVTHERVHVIGDKFGATDNSGSNPAVNPTVMGQAAPMLAAGQTPMHGGATPMHGGGLDTEASDDVWRPGGAIDQEAGDSSAKENDGWGTSNNDHDNDNNDGWGSSSNNQANDGGWGAPPPPVAQNEANGASHSSSIKQESTAASAIKREQASEIDHDADGDDRPAWLMERVGVSLKTSSKQGFVKEIHGGKIVVEFDDGSTESINMNDASMVVPVEHDSVLVTGGNEVGLEGTLVCIDGTDAILKDANDAFKIVEFSFLAKVKD